MGRNNRLDDKTIAFLGICAVGVALALSGHEVASFLLVLGAALVFYDK